MLNPQPVLTPTCWCSLIKKTQILCLDYSLTHEGKCLPGNCHSDQSRAASIANTAKWVIWLGAIFQSRSGYFAIKRWIYYGFQFPAALQIPLFLSFHEIFSFPRAIWIYVATSFTGWWLVCAPCLALQALSAVNPLQTIGTVGNMHWRQ